MNITETIASIPTNVFEESHIIEKHFDIRLSTNGVVIALVIWNISKRTKAFIRGIVAIEIIISTPTTPMAFFEIEVAPITLSVASPN